MIEELWISRGWRRGLRRLVLTSLAAAGLLSLAPIQSAAQASASREAAAPVAADSAAAAAPQPTPPAAVAPVAVVADAGPDGFGVRTSDGAFRLRFQGVAHYDGRAYVDDPSDRPASGFDVRRVRADVRGTVYGGYDFRLHVDYAGNQVSVLDAYLEGRFSPAVQLRAGKFKAPVGLERLQSVSVITFPEFALPTALVPNRDVGLQLHGSFGGQRVAYAIGVFNGVPDGGSGDTDLSDSKDVAGRLFLHPFAGSGAAPLRGLGIGIAGSIGDQDGTLASPGLPTLRTTIGRTAFLRFRGDGSAAGTARLDGRRTRISPQGYWYWGRVGLLSEYVRSRSEVRLADDTRELTSSAWQVAGSWVLTGGAPSYRGVVPSAPFDPSGGTWGAIELAARVQAIETDEAAFPLLANPAQSAVSATGWTAGVNWYLNRFVKLQTHYERTRFDSAEGGETLPAEGVFITRFQVAF